MNKKITFIVPIISLSFLLQSCIVAAVGAGIGATKWGNAQKAKARSQEEISYNQYVLGMQQINIQRQQKGLNPAPIMSLNEYMKNTR